MPRVYNTGDNVDKWYHADGGNGSSTHDVCCDCADELSIDPLALSDKLIPYNGDPQGDRGWEAGAEHPSYGDYDIDYNCENCGVKLTEDDD